MLKRKALSILACFTTLVGMALPVKAVDPFPCEIISSTTLSTVHISSDAAVNGVNLYRAAYDSRGVLLSLQRQKVNIEANPNNTFTFDGSISGAMTVKYLCWTDGLEPYSLMYEKSVDDKNVFSVSNSSGRVGDTVTVRVSVGGTVKTNSFEMKLVYDPAVLEFVSQTSLNASAFMGYHNAAGNFVYISGISNDAVNITKGSGIVDVTFRIKSTNAPSTVLRIQDLVGSYYDEIANNDVPWTTEGDHCSVEDGTVTIQ